MPQQDTKSVQAHLLIDKLLNLRDGASPINLVYDSLEQSARPLILEIIRRAALNHQNVVFVSHDTLNTPAGADSVVDSREASLSTLRKRIVELVTGHKGSVVIFDSLSKPAIYNDLVLPLLRDTPHLAISLVLVCHETFGGADMASAQTYQPEPLQSLDYLATTVFSVSSFSQALLRHKAALVNHVTPVFGIAQESEGLLVGRGANSKSRLVVHVEHRRRSGRAVGLAFVLLTDTNTNTNNAKDPNEQRITLLDHYPEFRRPDPTDETDDTQGLTTFNLGLTAAQRNARDDVVLPYFDAQEGRHEGGRILYDMGEEDDFDEEEDEI